MITFLFWATSNISLHQLILPKKHLYGSLYLLFLHKSILSEKFNDKWLIRNMLIRGWFDDPNELYVNIDAFSSSNQVMMYRCYFVNEVWALLDSTWQDQDQRTWAFNYEDLWMIMVPMVVVFLGTIVCLLVFQLILKKTLYLSTK